MKFIIETTILANGETVKRVSFGRGRGTQMSSRRAACATKKALQTRIAELEAAGVEFRVMEFPDVIAAREFCQ